MHRISLPRSASRRLFTLRDRFRSFESINPTRTAQLVINMQNVFLAPDGSLEIPMAREIVPNINRISKALRAAGGRVVHVLNTADANPSIRFSNYWSSATANRESIMDKFIKGSPAHALWPVLDLKAGESRVPKYHFSAFASGSSRLHAVLGRFGINALIITGTPTNICCESTARDAMSIGYKVIFVDDATAALDDEEHNAALGNMLVMSANVMCTNEVLIFIDQGAFSARHPRMPGGPLGEARTTEIGIGQICD
jgi:ureidoacrylate peracid hydrolase